MSKQGMWSINDSARKSRQTVQPHQPVWMAHWMKTSSNATAGDDSASQNKKELDLLSKDDNGKIEANTRSLRMSSKSLGNKGVFTAKDGMQLCSGVLAKSENSSREHCASIEGTLKKPVELLKSRFSAKERSSSTSVHSQERVFAPSTHKVSYHELERSKFDKGKAVLCPSVTRPSIGFKFNNHLQDTKLKLIGQEHFQWESEMGSHSETDTSFKSGYGGRNASLFSDAPSMNDPGQTKASQDWFQIQKAQKSSRVMSLVPCQSSDENEQKVSHYDRYPPRFPSSVHETMRICTTVDSLEATPRGSPWFSQTTRSLLITKKTDGNVSKETDIFRRLITQLDGNSSSDLEYMPPGFGQANRGLKLQAVSSSNSEGQGNAGDTGIGTSKFASKNESSTETDTLEMDFSKEERVSFGVNSTRSTKVFNFDNNLSPRTDVGSSREVGQRWMRIGLPDINLELPALPVASSSEDVHTSSRTQSLEMDMLLAQADPKSNLSLDEDVPKADPTTRWVKRLKLSSSESSARGTKSLRLTENPSHDKKGDIFKSILKRGTANSREHHGNETFSDRSANLSKEDEHLPPGQPRRNKELLLSHVWIKRWLSNGLLTSQKEPENVVREPQSLKSSLDELEKKQFPSIAAMAMMGKSMTGYQTCELQKRGSFTIWNTNAF